MEFIFQLIADLFLGDNEEKLAENENFQADAVNSEVIAEAPLASSMETEEANIFTMMEFH